MQSKIDEWEMEWISSIHSLFPHSEHAHRCKLKIFSSLVMFYVGISWKYIARIQLRKGQCTYILRHMKVPKSQIHSSFSAFGDIKICLTIIKYKVKLMDYCSSNSFQKTLPTICIHDQTPPSSSKIHMKASLRALVGPFLMGLKAFNYVVTILSCVTTMVFLLLLQWASMEQRWHVLSQLFKNTKIVMIHV